MKNKPGIIALIILVLAVIAGNFVYPDFINQGIGRLNSGFNLNLPRFWDVPFKLGLDLKGGMRLIYEADLSQINKEDYSPAMGGLRDVIERRINLFGVQEPVVRVEETLQYHRLVIELAGIQDPAKAIEMIGQTPFLEFKEVRTEEETQKILDKKKELEGKTSMEEIQQIEDWSLAFEDPYFKSTSLTGRYLKRSELDFDPTTSKPVISLQFDDEGSKIFEELTSRNIGQPLAIYIDNVLISSPVVQEAISGGRAQISGQFNVEDAKKLANNLSAGALPVPINLISQQWIGPTLGEMSLQKTLKAGAIGFLAVVLFMLIFYRLPGILATLALIIYLILNLFLYKLIPVTLTLAGIAGFILSLGMAVDGNILIFSRMREEFKKGNSFQVAIEEGFRRAWPSIRDGNLANLIVALFLFSFGTSFVKGFAFTLCLGTLLSIFSSVFVSKNFLRCFYQTRFEKYRRLWGN